MVSVIHCTTIYNVTNCYVEFRIIVSSSNRRRCPSNRLGLYDDEVPVVSCSYLSKNGFEMFCIMFCKIFCSVMNSECWDGNLNVVYLQYKNSTDNNLKLM